MGGKTAKSTQSVSIPPEVMARYNAVNERAEGLADRTFQRYSNDPNAFVAPLNDVQRYGMQQTTNYSQAAVPAYQQAMGMTLNTGEAGQNATNAAYQPLAQGYSQGQNYNNAAEGMYQQAGQAGLPYFTNTQNQINTGLQYGQGMNQQAMQQGLGAAAVAQPYYNDATSGTRAGLAGAQPYNSMATMAALSGSRAISPDQFSDAAVGRYMSPFMNNVVAQTMAAQGQQNAQQRQALNSDAIRSGAFGGDRAGIAQANLAYQQNLANNQTIANLLQGGYGQALNTFQQQQGVNLAADQANRAAQQQLAQQALAIGNQSYGQQMGAAQQMANLGQQLYGQQMGTAGFLQGLGQQAFGMGQGASAAQAALANQGYNMGMGTAQGYANLGQGLQNAGLQGAQAALQAGTIAQQTDQAGKQALYNQFLQEQSYPFQVAQFLANIAMGTGALSGSTTTTTQQAPFFSDKRLKDDIEPIGETYDGQKIVKFNYKGSPQKQIGLIAQDVEKHHPEAVGLAGGMKTVDYDAATKEAAERGHYARGGSAAFDQDLIAALLQSQAGQYAGMYGQPGTPRGAQGTPGAASRVPAASLPVGRLAVAGNTPQQPAPMFSQATDAAKKGMEIASLAKAGKEGLKYVTGGQDEKGNKIPSLMDRARAFGQPEQGPPMPGVGGTTSTTTTPGARADIGVGAAKVAENDNIGLGGKIDDEDLKKLDYDLFGSVPSSRGGLRMADGGSAEDEDTTAPEGLYKPTGAGLNIPDESNKQKPLEPAKPPGQMKSGFENALDAVKTAAKVAAMFMAADGGRIKKEGGGSASLREGLVPLTGEIIEPTEEEKTKRKEELVALAKANTGTATDVTPVGVGSAVTPTSPSAAPAQQPSAFERSVNRTLQFEGGLNPRDTNGTPSLYGINKKANPDVDFSSLTPEKAKSIYKTRYWDAIGADNMDPALAHVAFDTAVIAGPRKAKELIAASGGDPQKLLVLRQDFQNNLLQKDPEKYGPYAKAWNQRIATLRNDITEGNVPAVAAPGVAGPGRGAVNVANAPFSAIMNGLLPADTSQKTRDIATSENFWVPLLAGVGTMLSSKSPYLASAIGEGLVGATGAYTGINKQQADIAATNAGTEKQYADIVKDSVFTDQGGRTWFRYVLPTGGYGIMSIADYVDLPDNAKPKLDPRIEKIVLDAAAGEMTKRRQSAASKPGTTPGTPAAAPRPVESAPIPPVGGPAVGTGGTSATPSGGATPGTATQPSTTPAPSSSVIQLPSELQQKYAAEGRKLFAGGTQMAEQMPDVFTPQNNIAKGANNQRPQLMELTTSLAALPRNKSLLASGKPQETLAPVAAYLNGWASVLGIPAVIDAKDLANAEAVNKAVNQLKAAAAKEGGQTAFAALDQFGATLPSNLNSPGAQAKLLAQLYYVNQREIDKNEFYSQVRKAAAGDKGQYAQFAMRAGLDADTDFNKQYSQAFYAQELKSLEKMFNEGPKGMTGPGGRPITWMEFLNKEGATLSAKERQQIENQFGRGILRYFGVQ